MSELLQVAQLPQYGYIIEMLYAPAVGCVVIISIIPYTEFDNDCIAQHKAIGGILTVKRRLPHKDDFDFKSRLEEVIKKIRQQRGL